jgi:MFS transporter, DHA2 family, methylenomycin A resistance protein
MSHCRISQARECIGVDHPLHATAVGWWTAAGSVAIAVGPIAGGLLLGVSGWRSIFLVNLPICLVGALLTLRVDERPRENGKGGFDIPASCSP